MSGERSWKDRILGLFVRIEEKTMSVDSSKLISMSVDCWRGEALALISLPGPG